MKKTIFLLAAAVSLFSLPSFAKKTQPRSIEKNVTVQGYFTGLTISDDVTVVLTDEMSDQVRIAGEEDMVDDVYAFVEDGRLYLGARSNWKKSKVTIYVPAKLLNQVEINGGSVVRTDAPLSNTRLNLHINGACKLDIRSKGKINITNSSEYDFEVKKKQ